MLPKHLKQRPPFRLYKYWRHDRMNLRSIITVSFVPKRCNSQAHQRKIRRERKERFARWFIRDLCLQLETFTPPSDTLRKQVEIRNDGEHALTIVVTNVGEQPIVLGPGKTSPPLTLDDKNRFVLVPAKPDAPDCSCSPVDQPHTNACGNQNPFATSKLRGLSATSIIMDDPEGL